MAPHAPESIHPSRDAHLRVWSRLQRRSCNPDYYAVKPDTKSRDLRDLLRIPLKLKQPWLQS